MGFLKKKKEEKPNEEVSEEVKEEIKQEPKQRKIKWEVTEIATQTAPAIINTETNETVDVLSALAMILNKLEDIEEFLST